MKEATPHSFFRVERYTKSQCNCKKPALVSVNYKLACNDTQNMIWRVHLMLSKVLEILLQLNWLPKPGVISSNMYNCSVGSCMDVNEDQNKFNLVQDFGIHKKKRK